MKVSAKWQIAYKNVGYKAGDVFDLEDKDFQSFKNDVIVISNGEWRKPIVKEDKALMSDTFANRDKYEKETGKKAFWMGKLTNGYLSWLKK
ncbi:MAG TPA: hypothetical protein PKW61_08245 [Tenuifilaceae bacterium]|nr:hypothetical protein [Tenuifilaceae bacterium]